MQSTSQRYSTKNEASNQSETSSNFSLKEIEKVLFWIWVVGQVLLWIRFGDMRVGSDIDGHLAVLNNISIDNLFPDYKTLYYAYHPLPIFWIQKILSYTFGLSLLLAAKTFSQISVVLSFLMCRAALRKLGVISTVKGVLFLYFTFSIPIYHYLGISVNHDVTLVLCTCGMLLEAAKIATSSAAKQKWRSSVSMVLWICIGLLNKYSGALLLSIPFLLWAIPLDQKNRISLVAASIIVGLGIAIVSPYYILRNYVPTGHIFYTTAEDYFVFERTKEFRKLRDANRTNFVLSFFFEMPEYDSQGKVVGWAPPKLLDVWQSYWELVYKNLPSMAAVWIKNIQSYAFALLTLLGTAYLTFSKRHNHFDSLGLICVSFGLIQLLALIAYHYHYPVPFRFSLKALYVPGSAMAIGFLVIKSLDWVPEKFKHYALYGLIIWMPTILMLELM